jgi:hypothetical protein
MAIILPGINKGPLGGPAGETAQAMQLLGAGAAKGQSRERDMMVMQWLAQKLGQGQQVQGPATTEYDPVLGMPIGTDQQTYQMPQTKQSAIQTVMSMFPAMSPDMQKFAMTLASSFPDSRKPGETREYVRDGKKITEQWTQQGWQEIGSSPQFQSKMITMTTPDGTRKVNVPEDMVGQMQAKGFIPGEPIQGKTLKAYQMQDGSIKYIPNNEQPPEGAIPYSTQTELTFDPKTGEMTYTQGKAPGGLTKKTRGALEEKLVSNSDLLFRTTDLLGRMDRTKFGYAAKLKVKGLDVWDKIVSPFGGKLDPESEQFVSEMSTFAQDAIDNINLYIKAITGAQMSEKEADRLRQAMPDFGEYIFSGDGYAKFKSKLENVIRKSMLVQARYYRLRADGFDEDDIAKNIDRLAVDKNFSLGSIEKQIAKEQREIGEQLEKRFESKLKSGEMTDADIIKMVKAQIKTRWGI